MPSIIDGSPIETTHLKCPSSEYCECLDGTEYEIFCPNRLDANITVRIEPLKQSNRIEIDCNTYDENIFNQLPELEIGDSFFVKFKLCPVNSATSIWRIFDRLNVKNVQTLVFTARKSAKMSFITDVLPTQLFNNLNTVTSLHLRSDKMKLPTSIFNDLRDLEFLQISSSDFSLAIDGIFRTQNQLKRLNLWGNDLRALTKSTFLGLSSVIDLDLSLNNINEFPMDALEYFSNVTNIDLHFNELSKWPQDLFNRNTQLQKIRIINNKMKNDSLPEHFLSGMQQLKHVSIEYSNLRTLPKTLFENSSNLQNISLAHNTLNRIPFDLFGYQIHLENLDLSFNQLTDLDDRLFNTNRALIVLHLSYNRLTNITR